MRCPYCNYAKARPKEDEPFIYQCPRCKYVFEVSPTEQLLEKLFSIPFSSVLYSLVILGLIFLIAWFGTINSRELLRNTFVGLVLFVALSLLVFYFTATRRKRGILLVVPKEPWIKQLLSISPILKMVFIFLVVAIGVSTIR